MQIQNEMTEQKTSHFQFKLSNLGLLLMLVLTISPAVRAQYEASEASGEARRLAAEIPKVYSTLYATLKQPASAQFNYNHCDDLHRFSDEGVEICSNEKKFWGFSLTNFGSPVINPHGPGKRTYDMAGKGSITRKFTFSAPEMTAEESMLEIYEVGSADVPGGLSHWEMYSDLIFLPRKVLPRLRVTTNQSGVVLYEVTLPTGELVYFNKQTKEITGGVLSELSTPIDENTNRFERKFAKIVYIGNGVMLRSDQRGQTPTTAGKGKPPVIAQWGKLTCKISRADIWQQTGPDDGGGAVKYDTDEQFYTMLNKKCGWNLSDATFAK